MAQQQAQLVTMERREVTGDPLLMGRYASGLAAYVLPKAHFRQKYAVVAVRYGSVDSRFRRADQAQPLEVPAGIAHFLEHKMFEKEDGDLFSRFARLGASANAYTSYTTTAYLFSTVEHFEEALELLIRLVREPYFTEESVRKEQGIIEQEIRMYEDDPGRCLVVNLMQALYHVHPVRLEIGGTVESIRQIDPSLLYMCHRTFYHPANATLAVAGDVDPQRVWELAGRLAADGEGHAVERWDPEEPEPVREARVEMRLPVSRPRLALGIKDPRRGLEGIELVRRELAVNLALDAVLGRSSDTFQALYEEGLIDDGFGGRYACDTRFAHTIIGGETPDPDRLERRLKDILLQAAERGVDPETFERLRRRELGEFVAAMDNPEMVANSLAILHFRGVTVTDYLDVLQRLDHRDASEALRDHVAEARMAVSVVLPGGRAQARADGTGAPGQPGGARADAPR